MTNARWTCAVGVLILGVWSTQHAVATTDSFSADTPPVVVAELFTSEGCSSCPPADQVLSQLVKRGQPGVEVLALGEHVDYWDRLGWRDPFSSSANSSRQAQYDARVFHRNEVYTPQLVIDGQLAAVGSDTVGIQRAIRRAADAPKATVQVVVGRQRDRELEVGLHVAAPPAFTLRESAEVLIAVVEDNLQTEVRRGENRGRTLKHDAVVRSLTSVGTLSRDNRTWSTSATVKLAPEWKPANIRLVAFLQEHESRRIVGAGAATLAGGMERR